MSVYQKSDHITITDRFFAATILKLFPKSVTPNEVTIFRFIMVPFVVLLFVGQDYVAGLILFAIAALSDAIDGALARTRNEITDWGKLYDPLADKILIGISVAILVTEYLGIYIAAGIILIDAMLITAGYYKKRFKHIVIQAHPTGKLKMIMQSVGVGALLLYAITNVRAFFYIGEYSFFIAIALAVVSLVVYRSI